MVNSLSLQEVYDVVEKAKQHFEPILSSKTFGYYTGVWNKLITYAETSADSSNVDLCSFYEKVAHTPAYTKPSTKWWMMQARAVFVLGDLIISAAPKREYTYNQAYLPMNLINTLHIELMKVKPVKPYVKKN